MAFVVITTLIFGVFQLCFALYIYNFVDEAARDATRFAMVRGSTSCPLASTCNATSTDIQNYVRGMGFPALNPNSLTVTTAWSSGNSPGKPVKVTVSYQFSLSIPFVPSRLLTLSSSSQMLISQ